MCVLFCWGVWHNPKHDSTAFCTVSFVGIALLAPFCFHQHVFTVFDFAFCLTFNTISFHRRLLFLRTAVLLFFKNCITTVSQHFFLTQQYSTTQKQKALPVALFRNRKRSLKLGFHGHLPLIQQKDLHYLQDVEKFYEQKPQKELRALPRQKPAKYNGDWLQR